VFLNTCQIGHKAVVSSAWRRHAFSTVPLCLFPLFLSHFFCIFLQFVYGSDNAHLHQCAHVRTITCMRTYTKSTYCTYMHMYMCMSCMYDHMYLFICIYTHLYLCVLCIIYICIFFHIVSTALLVGNSMQTSTQLRPSPSPPFPFPGK